MISFCTAYGGDEPPSIIWKFGDELFINDSLELVKIYESQTVQNGHVFTESILELCDVDFNDTGVYSCTANNSRGTDSYNFTLEVVPTGELSNICCVYKKKPSIVNIIIDTTLL